MTRAQLWGVYMLAASLMILAFFWLEGLAIEELQYWIVTERLPHTSYGFYSWVIRNIFHGLIIFELFIVAVGFIRIVKEVQNARSAIR